ncbi:MAG: serpin family protein [Acidimicrobiales bacterium]
MPAIDADLHTGFAFDLLRAVSAVTGEDVVVSPWSVASALAVLAPGTDGPARLEIERVLASSAGDEAPDNLVDVLAAHARLLTEGRGSSGAGPTTPSEQGRREGEGEAEGDGDLLVVANSLWVDEGRTAQPAFVGHLDAWPGAAVRSASMGRDPEGARAAINADVGETTRGLIPAILPSGSITRDDRAVVVNALYLLAGWIERFTAENTVDEQFHAPSGRRAVPTMRARQELRYAPGDWQYLALPLWPDLMAEVLLPPAGTDAPATVATPAILAERRDRARPYRVDLHLPRFRVECHVDLVPPLHRLGIRRIFEDSLAVPAVLVDEPLSISGAFHAAVLRLDERGIEGAAATALVARAVAFVDMPEVEVRVDRPFLVLVTHRRTGIVLFLTHVTEP